ncbi:adenylyl-sulfate kinase [Gracilibacillus massiliensis]|uniref:adenylyl-sulfate kinase n=1 Tax=Gracilibacillus massiliensis TaxID=1564956 RepID=UPI00071DFA01|nr:adenylyl-sulfate kinase [Gracilibacillus massiliensis]
MTETKNIVWHDSVITKQDRIKQNNHQSPVLWFTGLSGSGKSTLTVALEKALHERGVRSYRLDGDNIRHGLNANLGFTPNDRKENIRRIGEVSKLLNDAGLFTLTAFISPYREDRDNVRQIIPDGEFIEVYVKCSLESCEARDPKGLYQKARSGEIKGFTGIDAPYEKPIAPELVIDTESKSVEEAVAEVLEYLKIRNYL